MQRFTSPREQALAKMYIEQLRNRRLDGIESAADISIANDKLHDALLKLAAIIPAGEPSSITLVGAYRNYSKSGSVELTYEYRFSRQSVLITIILKNPGGTAAIAGFSVYPKTSSLDKKA